MGLADDVADLLSTSGVGLASTSTGGAINIFTGLLPPTPSTAMAVIETGGLPSVHTMSTGPAQAALQQPRVQVLSRAVTYDAAQGKATCADRALDGAPEKTINGTRYLSIYQVNPPFLLERDGEGRVVFAANYQVYREVPTS